MPNNGDTLVLVADDEPSMLGLVSAYVRSKGYRVLEASDGDNAWQLAREHLPDVVVLDVMMPGMSGWEVCKKIRESISLAHTGIVMLTGIGQSLNEMTSPLYGADAYIDKPFEFAELESRIRQTLEQRRQGKLGRPDEGKTDDSAIEEAPPSLRSASDDDDDDDGDDEDDDEAPESAPRSKGSEKAARTRGVPTRDTLDSESDDDDDLGDPDDDEDTGDPDDDEAPVARKKAKRASKKTASPASLSPEGFEDEESDEELAELLNNGPKKSKKKAGKKKAAAKKVASKKAPSKKAASKKAAKKAPAAKKAGKKKKKR